MPKKPPPEPPKKHVEYPHAGDPAAREIGKNLAAHRERRGFNRELVAALAGVSTETIKAIERGRSFPRVDVLVRIAMSLEVDVEDLLPDPYDDFFHTPMRLVTNPRPPRKK